MIKIFLYEKAKPSIIDEIVMGLTPEELAGEYNITEAEASKIILEHDRLMTDAPDKDYLQWCREVDANFYKKKIKKIKKNISNKI